MIVHAYQYYGIDIDNKKALANGDGFQCSSSSASSDNYDDWLSNESFLKSSVCFSDRQRLPLAEIYCQVVEEITMHVSGCNTQLLICCLCLAEKQHYFCSYVATFPLLSHSDTLHGSTCYCLSPEYRPVAGNIAL